MNKGRLDCIQVLRGIAALLVVLFHFRHYINDIYPVKDLGDRLFLFGEAGVDLFFVISGFIIVYSSSNKNKNTFVKFIIKRVFRLYPLYFVVLSIYLILYHGEEFNLNNIIKSYFLIPLDYNEKGPWFGLSTIYTAWTLTYEVYFYVVFSIAILVSHKYRAVICMMIIFVIMILSQNFIYGYNFITPLTSKQSLHGVIYNFSFISNPLVFDFILGMIVAYLYIAYDKLSINNILSTSISLILLSLSVILIISHATAHVGPLSWGMLSAIIVFSVLIISKNTNINYPRSLMYFGEMSYSIYINHVVVKKVAFYYIGPLGFFSQDDGGVILFSLIISTLCLSFITYNFIEKPCVKYGHIISEKLRTERETLKL